MTAPAGTGEQTRTRAAEAAEAAEAADVVAAAAAAAAAPATAGPRYVQQATNKPTRAALLTLRPNGRPREGWTAACWTA